jgi:thioredoxin
MNFIQSTKVMASAFVCSMLLGCATEQKLNFPTWFGQQGNDQSQEDHPLNELQQGQDLEQVLAAYPGPVLLDFYADWCGPCKKQAKILHQVEPLAAENNASILKINVEAHPRLAEEFQANALPTLVLVKDGQIVARKKGLTNQQQLAAWFTAQ